MFCNVNMCTARSLCDAGLHCTSSRPFYNHYVVPSTTIIRGFNFRGCPSSPRKPRKFSPANISAHTVAGYAGGLVSRSHTVFCGWVSTRCRVGQLDAQEVNFGTSQLGSERLRLGAYRSSQLQTSSRGQFPTYWEPL